MFVAAWIRRLARSIARNGPHANAPSASASAVPKSTGTADAVRLNGRASLNHSLKTWLLGGFIVRPIVERVARFCNRSVHGLQAPGIRLQEDLSTATLLVRFSRFGEGYGKRRYDPGYHPGRPKNLTADA